MINLSVSIFWYLLVENGCTRSIPWHFQPHILLGYIDWLAHERRNSSTLVFLALTHRYKSMKLKISDVLYVIKTIYGEKVKCVTSFLGSIRLNVEATNTSSTCYMTYWSICHIFVANILFWRSFYVFKNQWIGACNHKHAICRNDFIPLVDHDCFPPWTPADVIHMCHWPVCIVCLRQFKVHLRSQNYMTVFL